MKNKIYIILFLILGLASFLRLWGLGSTPIAPDWDEAALGYNAYSIMQTGKDEYGEILPVVFRSFDDYKPGLYIYLIIPFIPLFDLSTFTVRLPSALFGILTVAAVFFLVRELFKDYKYKDYLSLVVSFLLSISPWHLQVSRVAFETNVGLSFNILMALFFIVGLRKPKLLLLSPFFAALSIYSYQSEKVFTPLLALALVIIYRKELFSLSKKYIISALIIGLITITPLAYYTLTNEQSLLRATSTSVFAQQTTVLKENIIKLENDWQSKNYLGVVLNNRRVEYTKIIIGNYLSHFDLNWLFVRGDLARHHAPFFALFYHWEFIFLLVGLYSFIFGNFSRKTKYLILSWFLLAPVPAAVTFGVPHTLRTLNFLPTWQIFIALGVIASFLFIKNLKFKKIKLFYPVLGLYLLFMAFDTSFYLNQYFVQQNYYYALDWQYGWKEAADYIKENEGKYEKIIVTDKMPLDRSYMFLAFYLKYPPDLYQKEAIDQSGGFGKEHSFGKFIFRDLNWDTDSLSPNTLIVGHPKEIPEKKSIKTIKYPDGKDAIYFFENVNED